MNYADKTNIESVKEKCCGCSNCSYICPTDAIQMRRDNHGFLYPIVERDRCVSCSKCLAVCPAERLPDDSSIIESYYGNIIDEEVRKRSSSGGAFSAFARYIIDNKGIVFGVYYDASNKNVKYASSGEVTLDQLRRSKYVEADTRELQKQIIEYAKSGIMVLVCGTPCHIAAIRKITSEYPNVYLIDFVCGGVSSPRYFKEHLERIEKKSKSNIIDLNFRDKKYGWKRMLFTIMYKGGKKKSTLSYFEPYFNGFIEGVTKRRNCYSCRLSNRHSSDVTIADYWGYRLHNVKYDPSGLSLIIVNTTKGKELFSNIKEYMNIHDLPTEYAKYTIKERKFNEVKYTERNRFFELAQKNGYEYAAKKTYMRNRIINLIKSYF